MKRFLMLSLLVGLCISGTGCTYFLFPRVPQETPYIYDYFGIQPLPENHGSWSKDEVDAVMDAIITVAEHHGLKRKWVPYGAYAFPGKHSLFILDAVFYYKTNGIGHQSNSIFHGLNIQKQKGTIWLTIEYLSSPSSDFEYVRGIWWELLDLLRNRFGDRMSLTVYQAKP